MWQRIQTVFLVIAVLALFISLVQPIWILNVDAGKTILTPFYLLKEGEYQYFPFAATAMLAVASITISITEILKYKNRLLQIKLGALNSLFLVGVIGCSVYFATQLINEYQAGQYGFGLYLPVVAVFCNLIANYFIRKDEKMVRDSNRLR